MNTLFKWITSVVLSLITLFNSNLTAPNKNQSANINNMSINKMNINATTLWDKVNQWESSQGYQPYIEDSELCNIATDRISKLLSDWKSVGLDSFQSNSSFSSLAENDEKDFKSEDDILNSWLSNSVNKNTLTAYYKYSCLKCVQNICVQIFGNKKVNDTASNPIVKKSQTNANSVDWSVNKIDEHTTDSRMPPDERMATAEELFIAINNYRKAHNINEVQKNDTLCRFAQTRANQLGQLGKLDNHDGFGPLAHSQQEFNSMDEIIQGGVQPNYAVHIVEWGWGRSLTGHNEAMLNPKWTHGCGGVSGYFSVFIFGGEHI